MKSKELKKIMNKKEKNEYDRVTLWYYSPDRIMGL
jgi:hypothetical protein